jgi:hypothetical protein
MDEALYKKMFVFANAYIGFYLSNNGSFKFKNKEFFLKIHNLFIEHPNIIYLNTMEFP